MEIYQAKNAIQAEKSIKAALAVLDLPIRGSYDPGEVCSILGLSEQTFYRLIRKYEVDEKGKLRRPDCLKTFLLGKHRRVSVLELVDFIRRNDEYLRNNLQTITEKGN